MKRVKRVYRKIKQKLDPLMKLDVYNQQHQLLILGLVILGTLLFAMLHSLFHLMFYRQDDIPIFESSTVNAYIDDLSKCWKPEHMDMFETLSSTKQHKAIQQQWRVDLKYLNCRSHGKVHVKAELILINNSSIGSEVTIRQAPRIIYEYEVVKHMTQQIQNGDFSTSSKLCNVHMDNKDNSYFNHNQLVHGNNSTTTTHQNPNNNQPIINSSNNPPTPNLSHAMSVEEQQQQIHHILTHSRLSDAGMCLQQVHSATSDGAGSGIELLKCLPSFIIAGVMKSGTGELMKWLNTHPNLVSGRGRGDRNEVHYFTPDQLPQYPGRTHEAVLGLNNLSNKNGTGGRKASSSTKVKTSKHNPHIRSLTANTAAVNPVVVEPPVTRANFISYAAHFPSFHSDQANLLYTFDKSPDYVRSPSVLFNIRNMLPSVKMIMLLRNPVKRVVSAFSHNCRHKRYIKLTKSVTINGREYPRGSVVTTNSDYENREHVEHPYRSTALTTGRNETNPHIVRLSSLSKSQYRVLKHPCSARDLHSYLFGLSSDNNDNVDFSKNQVSGNENSNNETVKRDNIKSTQSPSNSSSSTTSQELRLAPEIEHGFYDEQLRDLLDIFPKEQVLVLFQEDMYRNTFRTLRMVEHFLSVPCFDFSSVALAQPLTIKRSETAGEMSDEEENQHGQTPPQRAPVTFSETMAHFKDLAAQFFQLKSTVRSTGSQLQRDMTTATSDRLKNIYRAHNQRLVELLRGRGMEREAGSIRESGWDL